LARSTDSRYGTAVDPGRAFQIHGRIPADAESTPASGVRFAAAAGWDLAERAGRQGISEEALRARLAAETVVVVDGHADRYAETLPASELPASVAPEACWCIDAGAALTTKTTFELWTAIERGEIAPSARVWREGMECWTPIAQVAELALALPDDAPSATSAPASPEATATPETPGTPAARGATTPEPATIDATTSPIALPGLRSAPPPSMPIPLVTRRRSAALQWVAMGSAIAASAVAAALIATSTPEPIEPASAPAAIAQGASTPPEARAAIAAPAPPPASRKRHDEPGQRRLRAGERFGAAR
jgi:GYF domain 2